MQIPYCFCNDIFNHILLCGFYQGRLLIHLTIPFEEKPKTNLPRDNLRYCRLRKRLTSRQLPEQIDVVPATILMYEQDKHPIPCDVANALSKALEVDVGILYDDFADFLSVPSSEALKSIRGSGNVSKGVCGAYRGVSQIIITNSDRGTEGPPGRSI